MTDFLPDVWSCVATCERVAATVMASGVPLIEPFVLAAEVDAVFTLYAPLWSSERQAAWEAAWRVTRDTITIEDVEIEVYLVDQQWMIDLYDCQQLGGCTVGQQRGLICNFYNSPSSA